MNLIGEDEIKSKFYGEVMAEAEEYFTLAKEYRERKSKDDEEFVSSINKFRYTFSIANG
jgi:hypothetical protein